MRKEPTKQANFRLPETLLEDLKKVSEVAPESQTDIVKQAVQQKVDRLKNKYGIVEAVTT